MCGILGIKKEFQEVKEAGKHSQSNEEKEAMINDLIIKNEKRGPVSTSIFSTPVGQFFHFRAPTSKSNLNNLAESYPLTCGNIGLIGNGVINEEYYKSIKLYDDYNNENDLYHVLRMIKNSGINSLGLVKGCFALAIFYPNGDIHLVKNTYPLYYTDEVFSSVKFEGSKLLEDGVIYNWTKGEIEATIPMQPSPFL